MFPAAGEKPPFQLFAVDHFASTPKPVHVEVAADADAAINRLRNAARHEKFLFLFGILCSSGRRETIEVEGTFANILYSRDEIAVGKTAMNGFPNDAAGQ